MIKISVIYIGIVVILSAFIAGVPFVLWSDDTAEQVEKVANIPLGQIIRPVSGGAAAQTAGGGSAPASSSGSLAPTPMPAGLEEARAAILQDLLQSPDAGQSQAAAPAGAAPPVPQANPVPQDGIAAAVAAAVQGATQAADPPAQAPDVSPRPKPNPAAKPAAQGGDDLQAMTGLALDGLRQLRGKTLDSLDYLVPKALAEGPDDAYIQALLSEAAR